MSMSKVTERGGASAERRRAEALTDADLSQFRDAFDVAFPRPAYDGPGVRLSDLVATLKQEGAAGALPKRNVYRDVSNLEELGVAAPDFAGNSSPGKRYRRDDALRLFLGCRILAGAIATPQTAADRVREYRMASGESASTRVVERLIDAALDRAARLVRSRLLSVLVADAMRQATEHAATPTDSRRVDHVQPGTLVLLAQRTHGTAQQVRETRHAWIQRLMRTAVVGVTTSTDEILLIGTPADADLDGRSLRIFTIGDVGDEESHVLVLGAPNKPTTNEEEPELHSYESPVIALRLLAATRAFPRLATYIRGQIAVLTSPREGEPPTEIKADVTAWILAHFVCLVVTPEYCDADHHDRRQRTPTRCDILVPSNASNEPGLEVYVSSIQRLDEDPSSVRGALLRWGQLLAGWCESTRLSIGVRDSSHPEEREYIAQLSKEQEALPDDVRWVRAVPIPLRGAGETPVLYVSRPCGNDRPLVQEDEALETDILDTLLQVIAPIVGEILERGRENSHTVVASTQALRRRWLTGDVLDQAIIDAVGGLNRLSRQQPPEHRLPLILVQAARDPNIMPPHGQHWLRTQLAAQVPEVFLGPWMQQNQELKRDQKGKPTIECVMGGLADGTVLICLPSLLNKSQIDQLRDALPARLNALAPAQTEAGAQIVKLNVWVLDRPWSEIADGGIFRPESIRAYMQRARRTAMVLDEMVQARRQYLAGLWTNGAETATAGLDKDPKNAYLLRHRAECRILEGDFIGGERDAADSWDERETDTEPGSMRTWLLQGDARLGQGDLVGAVAAYDKAIAIAPDDPTAHYARADAVLTTAWLIRLASGANSKRRSLASTLAGMAAKALREASAYSQHPTIKIEGDPPISQEMILIRYDLAAAALLTGDSREFLRVAETVSQRFSRSSLLRRQLILARLLASGMSETFCEALSDQDVLIKLRNSLDPAERAARVTMLHPPTD